MNLPRSLVLIASLLALPSFVLAQEYPAGNPYGSSKPVITKKKLTWHSVSDDSSSHTLGTPVKQVVYRPNTFTPASELQPATPQPALLPGNIPGQANGAMSIPNTQPTPVYNPVSPVTPVQYTPVSATNSTAISNNCCVPATTTTLSPANPCCQPVCCTPTPHLAARPVSPYPTVLVKDGLKASKTYYTGSGLIGQPKLYVENQPIRNFFRYIFP